MARRTRGRRLVLAALVSTSIGLMVLDVRQRDDPQAGLFDSVRAAVGNVAGPLQEEASVLPRAATSWAGGDDSSDRVAELERQNSVLAAQAGTGYDRQRADELDGLLRVAGRAQYPTVPARVIAMSPVSGFSRAVTIDAGRIDGLTANMTVLNSAGLVGRVTTVSETTSTVMLAIDASATVGVRLENSQAGYAQGAGGSFANPLTVDLFSPNAAVKEGDRLVTFGSSNGAPYVAGVPVGEVIEVKGLTGSLTKRVLVRPYVDFGSLDLVGVVVAPPRKDPRTVLLPPRETAAATPGATSSESSRPSSGGVLSPPAAAASPTPTGTPRAQAEGARP